MSRALVLYAAALAVAVSLALAPHAAAQPAGRQVVAPAGATPSATLSPAIRVGNVLYLSGQLGMSRESPDTTIQGQTTRALENLKRVVEAAGATMEHIAKCTVFLTNVAEFRGMNEAYVKFFPKAPPARSTVVVAALVSPGAKVEIECIAAGLK
ncbi:MAG: RidA family protein [Gemmatimonadaceae bacterium]